MKKWIATVGIVIYLAVIGGFYLSDDSQDIDFHQPYKVIQIDQTYTYTNPSGFSFEIPEKWVNKAEIIEDGNKVTFNATIISDNKLRFFSVLIVPHKDFQKNIKEYDLSSGYLGRNKNYVFFLSFPLDVNFRTKEESNKYSEELIKLRESDPDIRQRIKIGDADIENNR